MIGHKKNSGHKSQEEEIELDNFIFMIKRIRKCAIACSIPCL